MNSKFEKNPLAFSLFKTEMASLSLESKSSRCSFAFGTPALQPRSPLLSFSFRPTTLFSLVFSCIFWIFLNFCMMKFVALICCPSNPTNHHTPTIATPLIVCFWSPHCLPLNQHRSLPKWWAHELYASSLALMDLRHHSLLSKKL